MARKSDFPEINKIDDELDKIRRQQAEGDRQRAELVEKKHQLRNELSELRDWIWRTNNPNIVELRRQLLAAARLAYDENEEGEDEENGDESVHLDVNVDEFDTLQKFIRRYYEKDPDPFVWKFRDSTKF